MAVQSLEQIIDTLNDLEFYYTLRKAIKRNNNDNDKGKKKGRKKSDKFALIPRKVWVRDPTKEGGGYYAIRWVKVTPAGKEEVIHQVAVSELAPELLEELKEILEEERPPEEVISEATDKELEKPVSKRTLLSEFLESLEYDLPSKPPKERELPAEIGEVEGLPAELPPKIIKDPVTGVERRQLQSPDEVIQALESGELKYENLTRDERSLFVRSKEMKNAITFATRGYPKNVLEDMKQEMLLYGLGTLFPKYDPTKGKVSTFLSRNFQLYAPTAYKNVTGERKRAPYDVRLSEYAEKEAKLVEHALEIVEENPDLAERLFGPEVGVRLEELINKLDRLQRELAERLKKIPKDLPAYLSYVAQLREVKEREEAETIDPERRLQLRGIKVAAKELWADASDREQLRKKLGVNSEEELFDKLSEGWRRFVRAVRQDFEIARLMRELKETRNEIERLVLKSKLLKLLTLKKAIDELHEIRNKIT